MAQENVHAVAHLHAHPDKTEELNSLLKSLLEPTRKESGCLQFNLLQNRDTPAEFAVVSEWLYEQAVQEHARTSYSQRAISMLPELLAAPMDLRFYYFVG
jgi:quinol monooxygenase YgiN